MLNVLVKHLLLVNLSSKTIMIDSKFINKSKVFFKGSKHTLKIIWEFKMWFKVILLSFYLGNFIYISLKVLFGMKTALSTFEPIIRLAASSLFGKFKGNERSIYIRPRETQSGFGISTKKEIKLLWKGFSFLHGYHVIPEGWL